MIFKQVFFGLFKGKDLKGTLEIVSIRKPRFLSGVATLAARQMPDPQGFEIVESHSTPDLSQKCGIRTHDSCRGRVLQPFLSR